VPLLLEVVVPELLEVVVPMLLEVVVPLLLQVVVLEVGSSIAAIGGGAPTT
jgi:type III secretory pathway component EscU